MLSVISTAFLIQQSRASDQGSQLNQHVGSYQSDGINSGSALNQQFFQLSQEVNDIEADSSPRIKLMDRARTTYQQNQGDSSQKKFRNLRSYSSTPPKDVPIQAYTGVFIIVGIVFILMTICVAKLFFKYQYREGQAQLVCKASQKIFVKKWFQSTNFRIQCQHQLERMIDNQPAMGSPVYEKQEYSNLPPIKNKNNQMQNPTALPNPQNLIPQLSISCFQQQLWKELTFTVALIQSASLNQSLFLRSTLHHSFIFTPYVPYTNINQDANQKYVLTKLLKSGQFQPQYQEPKLQLRNIFTNS
eukprot:403353855